MQRNNRKEQGQRERERERDEAEGQRRQVLVIGCGPAGLMSALIAALRNSSVECWDKRPFGYSRSIWFDYYDHPWSQAMPWFEALGLPQLWGEGGWEAHDTHPEGDEDGDHGNYDHDYDAYSYPGNRNRNTNRNEHRNRNSGQVAVGTVECRRFERALFFLSTAAGVHFQWQKTVVRDPALDGRGWDWLVGAWGSRLPAFLTDSASRVRPALTPKGNGNGKGKGKGNEDSSTAATCRTLTWPSSSSSSLTWSIPAAVTQTAWLAVFASCAREDKYPGLQPHHVRQMDLPLTSLFQRPYGSVCEVQALFTLNVTQEQIERTIARIREDLWEGIGEVEPARLIQLPLPQALPPADRPPLTCYEHRTTSSHAHRRSIPLLLVGDAAVPSYFRLGVGLLHAMADMDDWDALLLSEDAYAHAHKHENQRGGKTKTTATSPQHSKRKPPASCLTSLIRQKRLWQILRRMHQRHLASANWQAAIQWLEAACGMYMGFDLVGNSMEEGGTLYHPTPGGKDSQDHWVELHHPSHGWKDPWAPYQWGRCGHSTC